jgi:hypothetical protein
MISIKKLTKYAMLSIALFILSPKGARADGFPLRPGKLVVSASASYFFANSKWDSVGVKKPFDNDGKFTSYTYSVYMEYGISRRFAFVGLLPYSVNSYMQSDYKSNYSGLTDLETGIRYYLANFNYKTYISIQGTVITPMYTNTNLGYGLTGAEFKLAYAGSGHLFGDSFYFSLADAVRQYFSSIGPFQDRYNASFGLTLDKKFREQISLSVSGFYSTSNDHAFDLQNPTNNRDFSFTQASIGYGHVFSKNISLFLTGGHFIIGRNTGDGLTGSLAFVYRINSR